MINLSVLMILSVGAHVPFSSYQLSSFEKECEKRIEREIPWMIVFFHLKTESNFLRVIVGQKRYKRK